MHSTPHRQSSTDPNDPYAPLVRLRRRCIVGVFIAVPVFVIAFIVNLVRATPSDDATILGVEVATATAGAACTLTAAFASAATLIGNERQAESLKWAVGLGEDLADVYQMPKPRSSGS